MGANVETRGLGQRYGMRGLRPEGEAPRAEVRHTYAIGGVVGARHMETRVSLICSQPTPLLLQVYPSYRAQLLLYRVYNNVP